MNVSRRPEPVTTVNKKSIYIQLPFKGDLAGEIIHQRLYRSLSQTFNAATLRCSFYSSPLVFLNLKDRLPVHDQSMLVYSFSCCCTAEYVGRTTRCLSKRIKEHHPAWLGKGTTKTITSAIVSHLVDSNHHIDPKTAFKVVYKVPFNQPKAIRQRILATAESIAIRLQRPTLCTHKQFVQSLNLPWSKVNSVNSASPPLDNVTV